MSQSNKSSSNIILILGAIVTCIGVVVAAYIGYLGARSQSEIPIQATQTAETRLTLIAVTRPALKAIIQNELELPIEIYVNEIYEGLLESGSSDDFILDKIPAIIKFNVIRLSKGADGFWGVPMSGMVGRVENGDTIIINNQIGLDLYFYPIINNYKDSTCEIILDDNSPNRQSLGFVYSGRTNVTVGYLKLHSQSNITFDCKGIVSWYGRRLETDQSPLSVIIDPQSGKVILNIPP